MSRGIAAPVWILLGAGVVLAAWAYSMRADVLEEQALQRLARALATAPSRPVEGRLWLSSEHAPALPVTRGSAGPSAASSLEVRRAAAELETVLAHSDTPLAAARRGLAHLATGAWADAIEALEEAVGRDPQNAAAQNDLAVAYLSRAGDGTRPDDWVRALAAAGLAIAASPGRPQPYFNRALALRGLHLTVEEAAAWRAHGSVERRGPWADEGLRHLRAAERRLQRRIAADRLTSDTQFLRERIEDRLLPAWGAAIERRDIETADAWLREAVTLAARLADASGDRMTVDEVARIRSARDRRDESQLQDLATGHRLFGEARARWLADELDAASLAMAAAAASLARADSPYRHWSAVVDATVLRVRGEAQAALSRLREIPAALPPGYVHLRARRSWTEALVWELTGRYDRARELLSRAVDDYRHVGEEDNLTAAEAILAEAEWFLGERAAAWSHVLAALDRVDGHHASRRYEPFDVAARMAMGSALPDAALAFHDALVRLAATPRARAEVHLLRARTLLRLSRPASAAAALDRAETELGGVVGTGIRDRIAADIAAGRAEMIGTRDCRSALAQSQSAMVHYQRAAGTLRQGALLTLQARCREALGDVDGARADLEAAIELFEQRRAMIVSPADRVLAFDLERQAFSELIALHAVRGQDEGAALRVAERARAGVVAEPWFSDDQGQLDASRLPEGVGVVCYVVLRDRVLVWALTRSRRVTFSVPVGEVALTHSVSRIRRAIAQGADLAALRPLTASLYDMLIAPALAAVRVRTVVFVPDGPLFAIPFAALPDEDGQPLLETFTVATAPNLTAFVSASAALQRFRPASVLAVGDGHDPSSTGLPRLPRADDEAATVAALYPERTLLTGAEATRDRFLATDADVVHFAGHSVLDERYPMLSRMLFAPARSDSGWLLSGEIANARFESTRVIMLASCEGAAGPTVFGEGALSLARAYFAAGVPAVVASVWPVDDDLQTLVRTFHAVLLDTRDPARALRAGQRALLTERGLGTPVRVWGGFTLLGGLAPSAERE